MKGQGKLLHRLLRLLAPMVAIHAHLVSLGAKPLGRFVQRLTLSLEAYQTHRASP